MRFICMKIVVSIACVLVAVAPTAAQGIGTAPAKPEMAANCPGLIAGAPSRLGPAFFQLAALERDQVRLTYVGHSTFLIESPQLVRIATDYNDYVRPPLTPDIATMNHAHSTHFSLSPNPGIAHVLRGWSDDEKPARIDLQYKDVRVRNVPTNIRTFDGGTERHGNSIFVFEIANLCIAHLGHLHHTLTQQQLNEIGRVDIVLVPVDGSYTLDLDGMVEVLHALKAPLMIPMHYFSAYTLDRFLQRVRQEWDVEISELPSLVISKTSLPAKPKVLVLPGH
ncbi:MAG TPA: MBL fold metallo-hydrolase [Pseudolabrys sp.]|nr:MBL fold metallo-hydrolase [Pseudolabrys sp.]